ncbi:MAG: carbohydrate ABC transporter permease [Gemmobacter sp.]|uniref:carbohydrate ABC transporter permease n=1 Tax=Gemmobacter sp. TaxID=1898957 RepID=UPI00391BA07D
MTGSQVDLLPMWAAGWVPALLWALPLLCALWLAFHPAAYETRFDLTAPLTRENFAISWGKATFARYFRNATALVTLILAVQPVLCTLAAFAFARLEFQARMLLFSLVLVQLLVMPDILLLMNYRSMFQLGLVDTILAIGLPYVASGFAIFLLRQTFRTIPKELDDAARVEGCSLMGLLWRVYVPLDRPAMLAFALVSVSHQWNNFLWPLVVTNSVETRPLTMGLSIFATTDSDIEWAALNAATLMTSAPLLLACLLLQRQFVQSFLRAGIK